MSVRVLDRPGLFTARKIRRVYAFWTGDRSRAIFCRLALAASLLAGALNVGTAIATGQASLAAIAGAGLGITIVNTFGPWGEMIAQFAALLDYCEEKHPDMMPSIPLVIPPYMWICRVLAMCWLLNLGLLVVLNDVHAWARVVQYTMEVSACYAAIDVTGGGRSLREVVRSVRERMRLQPAATPA